MDLTPDELDELLGPWALGALDADELVAFDDALTTRADLAARARVLTTVVALLGEQGAVAPPPDLRPAVLGRATASRPRAAGRDPVTLLDHRIGAFAAIASRLGPDDWNQRADPYPWTVHGLVAHLLVIERYTARQLGLTGQPPLTDRTGHLDLGRDEIEAELTRTPAQTLRSWEEAARAVVGALRRGVGPDLDATVDFHGWPFPTASLLITRAFEIWTHAEDLGRAAGLPLVPPPAADLATMSSFSVSTLPLVTSLDHTRPPLGPVRIVLTGEGGATFDLGPEGEPETVLVLDVLDYCRLAARRAELHQVPAVIEGDPAIAARLATAAQFLAV